jgi:hypothetical protein
MNTPSHRLRRASWLARLLVASMLAFILPSTRSAEKTVAELQTQLAVAEAKIAVLEAQAALAQKQAALAALQPGDAANPTTPPKTGPKESPAPQANPPAPPPKTPPAPIHTTVTEDLRKLLPNSFSWWWDVDKFGTDLLVHAGTRVLAPYTIDKSTGELKSDGTRLGGYLEVLYSNTWAWQPDGAASSIAYGANEELYGGSQWNPSWKNKKSHGNQLLSDSDTTWISPLRWKDDADDTIDYTTRFSFEFANGADRSASTITGSGDFSGEVAFDAHFLQGYATNTLFTLGLGGSIGASTDREARRVHPRYFGGLVGKLSRVIHKDGKKRLALAHFGLGYARIDNVRFTDDAKTHVKLDGPVPRYEAIDGATLEFELFYPVLDANYAYVGARLLDRADPGQWSITLGYSFDPFELFKGFQSSSNPSESKDAGKAAEKKSLRSSE